MNRIMSMKGIKPIDLALLLALVVAPVGADAKNKPMAKPDTTAMAKPEDAAQNPMVQGMKVVMLRVNGTDMTVQDYATFLQRNSGYVQDALNADEGKVKAIKAMVGTKLIREAMDKEPGLLPKKERSSREEFAAAYEELAKKYFPIPGDPDEKTAYQYYLDHADTYGIPALARVSQIQFRYPDKATDEQKQAAKDKAELALKRLEAGEDFGQLAEQLTENPMAKLPKGDLGFVPLNADPTLAKALGGLKPGEHTGVMESNTGYEIYLLADHRPAMTSPYANVRQQVVQAIKDEQQNKLRDAYIAKLARNSKIELVQDELKKLFPNGVFP